MRPDIQSLRVLELGNAAAVEFCGKLFAGFGASVVRARLDNVLSATPPPGIEDAATTENTWFNTGKTRLTLDTGTDRGRQQLAHLLKSADLVLDGLGAGGLEEAGFSIDSLRAANPATIVLRVSSFGQDGPYRQFAAEEATLYALSGLANSTGNGAREPLNAGPRICSTAAGLKAAVAALMALWARQRTGQGDVIDLSLFEVGMDIIELAMINHLTQGAMPRRNNDEHMLVPWRTYPCKDGDALVIGSPLRRWPKAAEIFGQPQLSKEFANVVVRMGNRKQVEQLMAPWLMANDKHTVFHELQKRGLASSFVSTLGEALQDEQNKAREAFIEIDQPKVGRFTVPGAPFKSTGLSWRTLPAPMDDTALSAEQLWAPRDPAAPVPSAAISPATPLAGVRVVDLSHTWAGPHGARTLADYGAEVIKIEYPRRLDGSRGAAMTKINDQPAFWQINRNKKSVTLDLTIPEHLEVCKKLIATADIFIENGRPGVMEKLGIGHETLLKLNPRLVHLSLSGFGSTGPYASYAGYGGTMEAFCGMQAVTGYDPQSPRYRIRELDIHNGTFGVVAALAALIQREFTGKGQWIDMSGCETAAWIMGEYFADFTLSGVEPLPRGNRHPRYLQNIYPSAGDDRWIAITIRNDREWDALLAEMGAQDLKTDPRFADAARLREYQDEIDGRIAAWTRQHSNDEAMTRLQARGVPAGAVFNARDLAQCPQVQARRWLQKTVEDTPILGYPFRFTRAATQIPRRGPKLGEHNETYLAPLGLSKELWSDLSPQNLRTQDHVDDE